MKNFTLLIFLNILSYWGLQAQNVYIPDPNFRAYLQQNFTSCMNGDSLDSECVQVQDTTYLNLNGLNISDLSGIENFDSLSTLNCSFNNLQSLPQLPSGILHLFAGYNQITVIQSLPPNLKRLNLDYNQLSNLPTLPDSLEDLSCNNNSLTTLPFLPISIKFLSCFSNLLISLPELPINLDHLNVSINSILVLPSLPSSLRIFDVSSNQLITLPALPSSIEYFFCDNNQLNFLPSLPDSLYTMDCSFNQLDFLPSLPSGISILHCIGNQINSLPELPSSLNTLNCSSNLLTSLPVLPENLYVLVCSNNQLSTLPIIPFTCESLTCDNNQLTYLPILLGLKILRCSNNQLVSLPNLPSTLIHLRCNDNLITFLPDLPNLKVLHCYNNNIVCLPIFPSTILGGSGLKIYNNPFTCLPNYISAMDSLTLTYPLCEENNINGCETATGVLGKIYHDANNNCAVDSFEIFQSNVRINLFDNQNSLLVQTSSLGSEGLFNFPLGFGTYKVQIDTVNKPYQVNCLNPGIDTVFNLSQNQQFINLGNFSIDCKTGFDLGVQSIVPFGWVFPGQTHTLKILAGDMSQWYNLNCSSGISGQVIVNVSGPVSFAGVSSSALIPQVSGNVFTYNIADFGQINFQNSFRLLFDTDTTAQANDFICITVTVTPSTGDVNISNNELQFCYQAINSYDPNRKDVYPSEVQPGYQDCITYTVYFQNTGNAPAFNIRLRDTLSTFLDHSTFELLNYSHLNSYRLSNGILSFHFPYIMLPDSASDPEGSIGFVQFRLKPIAGLSFMQQINNQVAIYFDYNEPIFTNVAKTSYTDVKGSMQQGTIYNLFPQPAQNSLNINCSTCSTNEIGKFAIYDASGRLLMQDEFRGNQTVIPINSLISGVYFLKLSGNGIIATEKFIKIE